MASTKIQNPYCIRWAIFDTGERMPFLVRTATGMPVEAATFWIVAHRRPAGRQPNTLANELRSIAYLYLWAELRGIDIQQRLRGGIFFTLVEVIDLVNFCGRFLADILPEFNDQRSNVVKLHSPEKLAVDLGEKRNRLSAIHDFLHFTSADFLSKLAPWPQRWDHYGSVRTECLKLIDENRRSLHGSRTKNIDGREGLSKDAIVLLKRVIEPDGPENPFSPRVRFRNYVIIRLLVQLSLRRGELLGIKVSDCVFGSKATITVHRRPDDPEDTRRAKPATKTEARVLPLNGALTDIVHEWIVHHRPKIPGARFHPYLIVDIQDGRPMSLSNVNKMFDSLRKRVPALPLDLSPHVLRHTWNDLFSETMDGSGVPADDEVKLRARLMGWRNEDSAAQYLRRTVRERSDKALHEVQDRFDVKIEEQ